MYHDIVHCTKLHCLVWHKQNSTSANDIALHYLFFNNNYRGKSIQLSGDKLVYMLKPEF